MRLPDLNELALFAKVVEHGGFTAAGRVLGLPKSTLSRRVAALEERLGIRLLERTTRRLALTAVGRDVYRHAERLVLEAEEAERLASHLQEEPSGLLRVTAPTTFGRLVLAPMLPAFLRMFPRLRVSLDLSARPVDVLLEGYDVAIRSNAVPEPRLESRRLLEASPVLCASPDYLDRHGAPRGPDDLARHDVLNLGVETDYAEWVVLRGRERVTVTVKPRFSANDPVVIRAACVDGLGLAWLAPYFVEEDLRAGRLVRVLREYAVPPVTLDAVFPRTAAGSAKVRVFLDHVSAAVAEQVSSP